MKTTAETRSTNPTRPKRARRRPNLDLLGVTICVLLLLHEGHYLNIAQTLVAGTTAITGSLVHHFIKGTDAPLPHKASIVVLSVALVAVLGVIFFHVSPPPAVA